MPTIAQQEQQWNLAHLAEPVRQPAFAVWAHEAPAIVLGCSQQQYLAGLQAAAPGVATLVRASGGGAVLTGPWMVSSSVALPLEHPWVSGRINASYEGLGRLYVGLLARLGVAARALAPEQVAQADALLGPKLPWACFGSLASWEVVDAGGGRKLVGLAQRRQRSGVLLVAGTLVAPPDWALLCTAMGHAQDEEAMRRRTVACSQLAPGFVAAPRYAALLREALAEALAV